VKQVYFQEASRACIVPRGLSRKYTFMRLLAQLVNFCEACRASIFFARLVEQVKIREACEANKLVRGLLRASILVRGFLHLSKLVRGL
jgi:hypothetical protein